MQSSPVKSLPLIHCLASSSWHILSRVYVSLRRRYTLFEQKTVMGFTARLLAFTRNSVVFLIPICVQFCTIETRVARLNGAELNANWYHTLYSSFRSVKVT